MKRAPLRLAVLISGSGRTLVNLAACVREGRLAAVLAGVVSSRRGAAGNDRARELGIPLTVVAPEDHPGPGAYSRAVTEAVDAFQPDLVAMAGFIKKWEFPDRYAGRVMNIHPALLPKHGGLGFYGERVHRAVLASGDRYSGCTVHFADQDYDRGPIIIQRVIAVAPGDTVESLADRVFAEECKAYPEALRYFAEGRLEIRQGRVIIRPVAAGERASNSTPSSNAE